jgi:hypothetical protein
MEQCFKGSNLGPYEGPTTILETTLAPLDHCFILKIFLEFFNTSFKKMF